MRADDPQRRVLAETTTPHALWEQSPTGRMPLLAVFDARGRFVLLTPNLPRLLGVEIADVLGKTPVDLPDQPDARPLLRAMMQALESGEPGRFEGRLMDGSGRCHVGVVHLVPTHNHESPILLVFSSTGNPVKRHHARWRLKMSTRAERDTRLLRKAIDQSGESIVVIDTVDARHPLVHANATACRLLGYERDELLRLSLSDIAPDWVPRWAVDRASDGACAATVSVQLGESHSLETLHRTKDGRTFLVQVDSTEFEDHGRRYCVLVAKDISDRKRYEQELGKRERLFRTLVEHSPDMIVRYAPNGCRLYVNPAFAAMLDEKAEDLLGRRPTEYPNREYATRVEDHVRSVFQSGERLNVEMEWINTRGRTIHSLMHLVPEFDAAGTIESVLGIVRDVTELATSRSALNRMAICDPLTGLPNRALLIDRVGQAIADAAYHDRMVGVLVIDLDRFKTVNETIGYSAGDDILRQAAQRLTRLMRSYDTVSRLGGDEFGVLVPHIRGSADLGRIANKILACMQKPYRVGDEEFFVTCSVGISFSPQDGNNAEDLIKFSEMSVHRAKSNGRNTFLYYTKNLTDVAKNKLSIETALHYALERSELEVHFQPKIRIETGGVVGSEALLRWRSPHLGVIPPDQFIPIAEDSGLIVDIGAWVLRQSCRAACEWNTVCGHTHQVAVNLSARQARADNLVETLGRILAETGCRPEWIELEITESLLLDSDARVFDMLSAFRAMGVSIAVDDFGTGYSAFSYLANFPIDTLKIDRVFVQAISNDPRRAELVKAIISIAACLGQEAVAEGVETEEQVAFLRAHKCQFAQGWHYSKALPKRDMDVFLATHH